MARKKWIDKKSATTFALVHRAQNDPRIHDAEASDMVYKEVVASNQKIKNRGDLEEELGLDPSSVRDNEGEAANYGIYYDDTDYDYMQHMRDMGSSTEATWVEAPQLFTKQKGKGKQKLEDALRDTSLEDSTTESKAEGLESARAQKLLDSDVLPSTTLRKVTYQDQQEVPDALAGFQPDMDPRLREVLEALEDEAYVDDEDDVFGELAKDGEEVSLNEFEGAQWEDAEVSEEDDGWESDATAKPDVEHGLKAAPVLEGGVNLEGGDHGDGDWMKEFSMFRKADKVKQEKLLPSNSELQSSISTGSSMTGSKRRKRKGALTSSAGYSMTSSSIFRTEGQTLLDDRFDKVEGDYAEDDMDDEMSVASGTSSASQRPVRSDFDSIMDDFLGGYSMSGKRRVKKGGYQSGLEQLEEVRRGLGPARLRPQKA
ncbi:MAG: hypothetical protein M1827_000559 [Pycnora praestabilis]|nr:MAG: hypothetical protein M1827_000559 [Pycnora praestabilis]